jgi:hypothetical protein
MSFSSTLALACAVLALFCVASEAKIKPGDCEVCIAVVDKIKAIVPAGKSSNEEAIQDAIWKFCKTATGKDERFVRHPADLCMPLSP